MQTPSIEKIISALSVHKNVLLYGPPGTGKTWLLSQIIAQLNSREKAGGGRPTLKLGGKSADFGSAAGEDEDISLPENLDIEWITFHQSYSYEEFIIGKRPKPLDGGIILEPHFGILMSIAVNLDEDDNNENGCLIIIDEINRANASQVFGEFITLLDPDYRATISGIDNPEALKIRLPGIAYKDGVSEPIAMLRGGNTYQLPEDWTFPENIYVLATMNSVDRAALPLDSALTRRFHRIEMGPNLKLLATELGVDLPNLTSKIVTLNSGDKSIIDTITAEECTLLILDRLNYNISSEIGDDFQIGHTLLRGVIKASADDRWEALIEAWDNKLLPQLKDIFAGQEDTVKKLLKVPDGETEAAFYERTPIGGTAAIDAPLITRSLKSIQKDLAISVLRNISF